MMTSTRHAIATLSLSPLSAKKPAFAIALNNDDSNPKPGWRRRVR